MSLNTPIRINELAKELKMTNKEIKDAYEWLYNVEIHSMNFIKNV